MGKKLNFWAELYSESRDFDTMDEFQLSAEEWDALSEKDKYDLVEDWAEGQLHCGYDELGEEPDFADEDDGKDLITFDPVPEDVYYGSEDDKPDFLLPDPGLCEYDQEELRRYQGSEDCDDYPENFDDDEDEME